MAMSLAEKISTVENKPVGQLHKESDHMATHSLYILKNPRLMLNVILAEERVHRAKILAERGEIPSADPAQAELDKVLATPGAGIIRNALVHLHPQPNK